MNIDELRKAKSAEPFKPFAVNLADGRSFDIPHPEFLALPPEGRRSAIVFLPGDDGFEIIDPTLVTSLSFKPNGKGRGGSTRRKAGFSGAAILFLLIGVAVILILMFGNFGGGKSYTQAVSDAKKEGENIVQTIDYGQLGMLVAIYRQENDKLPATFADLEVAPDTFKDQWGDPVTFRFDTARAADATEVIVVSKGEDGRAGTPDDLETRVRLPY